MKMKIFPEASFANPSAMIDSRSTNILSLIMFAHIDLKPEMYLIVLFIVSNISTHRAKFLGVLKNRIT